MWKSLFHFSKIKKRNPGKNLSKLRQSRSFPFARIWQIILRAPYAYFKVCVSNFIFSSYLNHNLYTFILYNAFTLSERITCLCFKWFTWTHKAFSYSCRAGNRPVPLEIFAPLLAGRFLYSAALPAHVLAAHLRTSCHVLSSFSFFCQFMTFSLNVFSNLFPYDKINIQ